MNNLQKFSHTDSFNKITNEYDLDLITTWDIFEGRGAHIARVHGSLRAAIVYAVDLEKFWTNDGCGCIKNAELPIRKVKCSKEEWFVKLYA